MKKRKDEFDWQTLYAEVTIPSIFEEGFEKGVEKKTFEFVLKLLSSVPEFSDEKISDLAGANPELVKQCRKDLNDEKKVITN